MNVNNTSGENTAAPTATLNYVPSVITFPPLQRVSDDLQNSLARVPASLAMSPLVSMSTNSLQQSSLVRDVLQEIFEKEVKRAALSELLAVLPAPAEVDLKSMIIKDTTFIQNSSG